MELTGGSVVLNLTGQNAMKHVEKNDFIIHLRSFQGGLERVRKSGKVSTAYTVVKPKKVIDPDFFKWLLKSSAFIQELQTTTNQLRDGQSIRWTDFVKVPLPVPPRGEQPAIADYLDRETQKIDELITEQRSLIETLRERRVALIYELVSGRDEGGDRRMADSFLFSSLPSEWSEVSLRRIGDSKSGSGFPPSAQGSTGHALQFFKVKHLASADQRDVIYRADDTVSRETAKQLRAEIFPPGTIVYAKVGAALMLGRIRTLGNEGCIDNNMAGFMVAESVDSRYVQLAMSCIPFDYLVNPGAVPSLSDKNLMSIKIPLPAIHVQRAVAAKVDDYISRIDELISESQDLITLSQERRAALITAAVTGQIDVREAS